MKKEMFEEITAWQRMTFTKATSLSAAKHLREEVGELLSEINDGQTGWLSDEQKEKIKKEYADCFLLLFGSASLFGLSYDDICKAINDKMEINKQRKWGEVNKRGYSKHVKFKQGDVVFLIEDQDQEPFRVKEYTGKISRGPNRQFNPSQVVAVTDKRLKVWEFREDSLCIKP